MEQSARKRPDLYAMECRAAALREMRARGTSALQADSNVYRSLRKQARGVVVPVAEDKTYLARWNSIAGALGREGQELTLLLPMILGHKKRMGATGAPKDFEKLKARVDAFVVGASALSKYLEKQLEEIEK